MKIARKFEYSVERNIIFRILRTTNNFLRVCTYYYLLNLNGVINYSTFFLREL